MMSEAVTGQAPSAADRNAAMAQAYRDGASLRDIAQHAGISMQRVHKILQARADVTMREPYRGYSRPHLTRLPFPSTSRVGEGE